MMQDCQLWDDCGGLCLQHQQDRGGPLGQYDELAQDKKMEDRKVYVACIKNSIMAVALESLENYSCCDDLWKPGGAYGGKRQSLLLGDQ